MPTIAVPPRPILRNPCRTSRPCAEAALAPGVPPALITFGPRLGSSLRHHGVLTTSACTSVPPHLLQNLRVGGLPSPHVPQIRSPGRNLWLGAVLATGSGRRRAACGALSSVTAGCALPAPSVGCVAAWRSGGPGATAGAVGRWSRGTRFPAGRAGGGPGRPARGA